MPTTTLKDVCTNALLEINQVAAGDTPGPDDIDFVFKKALLIFDSWNARRDAVYADQFQTFTLTPSLQPHTIGPTGTFVTTQRPVTLEGARLIFATQGNPSTEIEVQDASWWSGRSLKSMTSDVPTDVYYEPDWPLGKLFFWPVPETAYQVELWTRQVFAALALTDPFSFPPGYQAAVTLTLAEDISGPFGKPISRDLERRAREARDVAFGNNLTVPRLVTSGFETTGGGGASGNYLTGWWS